VETAAAAWGELWPAHTGRADGGMGGSGLPLVGAAEGAVAGLAALDPQTLSSAAGGREAVAEDQSATDRSAVAGDQDPEEEKDLWAHQTGLSAPSTTFR